MDKNIVLFAFFLLMRDKITIQNYILNGNHLNHYSQRNKLEFFLITKNICFFVYYFNTLK
jgi:hypothetical protein